ncbi:uncharacterized protein [Periplaneta americana]|uniref:uncharacterized protein n=1 Tax=Periplaneta americana TaxID=6978 RepID=UPI0037E7B6B9
MSSAGNFAPPALIFARKKFKNELFDGAPTGTLGLINDSGWMTGELFLTWLQHFKKYANPTLERKVLLLIDGHSSHKYIDVLTYAKENGIEMLSFPPRCTHRLQPLDVSFFAPLKVFYNQEISKWLRTHPGRVVTQYQIAALFSVAYGKAATNHNALSGFSKTGIWPLNPDVFPDHVFNAAAITDRVIQENFENDVGNMTENERERNTAPTPISTSCALPPPSTSAISSLPVPSSYTTSALHTPSISLPSSQPTTSPSLLKPADISPLSSAKQTTRKRKHEGSQILTSSPYLTEVKAKVQQKKLVESRRAAQQARRKLSLEVAEDDEDSDESDSGDVPCLYCNDLFSHSKPKESWLRCIKCSMWAHSECVGLSKQAKTFTYDICK